MARNLHPAVDLLPRSDDVPVQALSRLFIDTATSYKHLFFYALLNSLKGTSFEGREFSIRELTVGMIERAWYPVRMFKLSLGHLDQIANFMSRMPDFKDRPIPRMKLRHLISDKMAGTADHQLFTRYVPYRILSPFFSEQIRGLPDHQRNGHIRALAASGFDRAKPLFRFLDDETIELHASWAKYLSHNLAIVSGWAELNWVAFLESRNPSLPGISRKTGAPAYRSSLATQTNYWRGVISDAKQPLRCIYSNMKLDPQDLHIDHVLPWTFVCHDSLWNLIPATPAANMAKGNQLPHPSYIPRISDLHFRALAHARAVMPSARWQRVAASYVSDLRISESDLGDRERFSAAYARAVRPQLDVAKSVGFQANWRWNAS